MILDCLLPAWKNVLPWTAYLYDATTSNPWAVEDSPVIPFIISILAQMCRIPRALDRIVSEPLALYLLWDVWLNLTQRYRKPRAERVHFAMQFVDLSDAVSLLLQGEPNNERLDRSMEEIIMLCDNKARNVYRRLIDNILCGFLARCPLPAARLSATADCIFAIIMHLLVHSHAQIPRDVMRTVVGLWKAAAASNTYNAIIPSECASLVLLYHERSIESKYLSWAVRDGLIPILIDLMRTKQQQDVLEAAWDLLHHIRVLMNTRPFARVVRRYAGPQVQPREGDPFRLAEFIWDFGTRAAALDHVSSTTELNCSYESCLHKGSEKHLKKCKGCMTHYYCLRECQRADWKAGHNSLCASRNSSINEIITASVLDRAYALYFARLALSSEGRAREITQSIARGANKWGMADKSHGVDIWIVYAEPEDQDGVLEKPDVPRIILGEGVLEECREAVAMVPPHGVVVVDLPAGGMNEQAMVVGTFDLGATLATGEIRIKEQLTKYSRVYVAIAPEVGSDP
ncbi:uncharacterized protein SCHCODRAFT_02630053 [Schizophyllum commune H4-8]|nr:uncharacterized protein SCHCODRAFT_02630053 [Schizophyllum commune H4-8]KAI5891784.1 hypothetical protein SCHCODRAFT_02630053 [Schizophyllum commune H4-8]